MLARALCGAAAAVGVLLLLLGFKNWPQNEAGFWGLRWLDFVYWLDAVGEAAEWARYMPQIGVSFVMGETGGVSPLLPAVEAAGTLCLAGALAGRALRTHQLFRLSEPCSLFLLVVVKLPLVLKLGHQQWAYRHARPKFRKDDGKKNEDYEQVARDYDEEAMLDSTGLAVLRNVD